MEQIKLENNITVFQFEPEKDKFLGVNITALFNNEKYMLIDAGYEKQINEVFKVLNKEMCEGVIITHFHPDHCYGLYEINTSNIIGSKYAFTTLSMFDKQYDDKLMPKVLVEDVLNIDYGQHKINIKLNSGHSEDGTIITINDKYVFCGDDIMYTNDGLSVIPYLASNDPMAQEKAIKRIIKIIEGKTLIPAHGMITNDYNFILKDANDRIIYLDYVREKKSYKEFKDETNISFKGSFWHKYNI